MASQPMISQLKRVIRKRKLIFVVTFLLVFLSAVSMALILPPVYRSSATLVVEEQKVSKDYVKSTVASRPEEHIDVIARQVLTRSKLWEIISRFNLYQEMRNRYAMDEILARMRGAIRIEPLAVDDALKIRSRQDTATMAFTISFQGEDPQTVRKVAEELAFFFVKQETKTRGTIAAATTTFFQEEMENLKKQIHQYENEISKYKAAHIGQLPESNAMNLQAIERLDRELAQLNMTMRSLEDRKAFLKGQIALVEPVVYPVVTEGGEPVMNPKNRLKNLRGELIRLQSTLTDEHPDIKRVRREIKELELQVSASADSGSKSSRPSVSEGQVAAPKSKLGPTNPDGTDKSAAENANSAASQDKADNPAYINLMTQIASVDIELKSVREEKNKIQEKMNAYQRRLENAPLVEKEYNLLTLDYESAKRKYDELLNKLMESKVAQGMEETQPGRFAITDPPQLPDRPYGPNRMRIILFGFMLALGGGACLAWAREQSDHSVKTVDEIHSVTGVPVFSVVPLVVTQEERRSQRTKRIILTLAAIGVIAGALFWVNRYEMSMGELGEKIQRKAITFLQERLYKQ